jgi:hypothetical protein
MMRHSIKYLFGGLMIFGCGAKAADMVIDLKNGIVTETFNTALSPVPISGDAANGFTDTAGYATVTLNKKTSGICGTPYEALVQVNLSPSGQPSAQKVKVQIEHEGTPSGWTTHVGDDVNNDGFGGGSSLKGVAELQVLDQVMSIYTAGFNPGEVDRLYGAALRLTDGALSVEVADQSVTVGQPRTIVSTLNQKQLFDFSATDKKMFAGFNRVISNRTDRKGCGVKRVVLSFE